MPITSPVDFISGPKTESTPVNRPKGRTASLTATGAPINSSAPSPCLGKIPSALNSLIVVPNMMREQALAKETPVAFETNGTVLDARGFASSTYKTSFDKAYCTFNKPITPTPVPMAKVLCLICSICSLVNEIGGKEQALSPE